MDEYNQDELCAPNWMDDSFFENVLRKCENNESILVKQVKITPATLIGDHFASVMFRATISYDTSESKGNSKAMIIKTLPEDDGLKKEMFEETFIFETEISMYAETIPKFEAELRKIGDGTVLGARMLYHSLKPRKCIIFEDIVPLGYATIRERMANKTESKAALMKLAKWHAVSYKLAAEGDDSVTSYKEGFLNMKNFEKMPYVMDGMDNFIDVVATIDELKMCIPQLKSIKKDLVQRCIKSFNSYRHEGNKGIFVLCHGDFHVKNMMFKHNKQNEVEDVMLIDFQVCYFGPAVLDILYAVHILLSPHDRMNHAEELIHYYCENFIETLQKFEFKGEIPKIADFMIELLNHRHFDLLLLSTFSAMVYSQHVRKADVGAGDLLSSNDIRKQLYRDPDFLNEIKHTLPKMLYKGSLE